MKCPYLHHKEVDTGLDHYNYETETTERCTRTNTPYYIQP